MTKKQKILFLLVILPIPLAYLYNKFFEYSGNWLEDYQNYFKIGFFIIAILGSFWLIVISKKDKNYPWLIFSVIMLLVLIVTLVLGLWLTNISI